MAKRKNKKQISKAKVNYSLALAVSDRVQIENVRLVSCECFQTPNASIGKKKLNIDSKVRIEANKKNGFILVFPTFKLDGFSLEGNRKEPDIVIEATFVLIYKADSLRGLKKENFEAFGNINGIYNAWPYWREFVQNSVARMGLPPLTIPVFRLVTPRKTKKVKSKKAKKKVAKKTK